MKLSIFGISKGLELEYGTISLLVIRRPELLRKIIYEFVEKNNDSNEVVITNGQRIYLDDVILIENLFKIEIDMKKVTGIIGKEIQKELSIDYDKEMLIRENISAVRAIIDGYLRRYEFDYDYYELFDYAQILRFLGFDISSPSLNFVDKICNFMEIQSKLFSKKIFAILNMQALLTKEEIKLLESFAKEKNIAIIGIDNASFTQIVVSRLLMIDEEYSY